MILAKIRGLDREMMVIGLSGENVTRLAAGEPVFKDLDEGGFLPGHDLVILYGKTEADIKGDLAKLVERITE